MGLLEREHRDMMNLKLPTAVVSLYMLALTPRTDILWSNITLAAFKKVVVVER